jgi:hypothetical protein
MLQNQIILYGVTRRPFLPTGRLTGECHETSSLLTDNGCTAAKVCTAVPYRPDIMHRRTPTDPILCTAVPLQTLYYVPPYPYRPYMMYRRTPTDWISCPLDSISLDLLRSNLLA